MLLKDLCNRMFYEDVIIYDETGVIFEGHSENITDDLLMRHVKFIRTLLNECMNPVLEIRLAKEIKL